MANTIYVQAVKRDRKIIIAESDDRHPNGEAWVAGDDRIHEVGLTPDVSAALSERRIVQVSAPANATPASEQPPDPLAPWPELAKAGYTTVEAVQSASDEALTALGIDSKKLAAIRKVAPKAS